ncbi:MAG: hypothetical protein ACKE51_04835 [Methylococcaceae bacterium]
MSQIHQIQFQFLPIEDRLLLKINTTAKEEFSFLLTRRFVSILHPILNKILHENPSVSSYSNEQVRDELINLQQQDAIQKTNTTTPYQNKDFTHPLGSQPILLAKIATNIQQGIRKLTLEPEKGVGISFTIEQNLAHLLTNLLLESLDKTDWQLGFKNNVKTLSQTDPSNKKHLH